MIYGSAPAGPFCCQADFQLRYYAPAGAARQTELWVNSATEAVVTSVSYAHHPELGLWLPRQMTQTFEWKELDDVKSNRNVGAYGARLFFQANATYTSPQHTPVDLTRMRR